MYLPHVNARLPQREPLFTFAEIAERLGTTPNRLQGLGPNYPGLTSVKSVPGGMQQRASHPKFRLSEARRWWAALPSHVKGIQ